jgi:hypothetical protein
MKRLREERRRKKMTVAQLRALLANLPDDMRIALSYEGSVATFMSGYTCFEDDKGSEINESEATSSDFLVFVE